MARRTRQPAFRRSARVGLPVTGLLALFFAVTGPAAFPIDRIAISIERIEAAGTTLRDAKLDLKLQPRTGMPAGRLSIDETLIGPISLNLALRDATGSALRFTGDRFRFAGGELKFDAALAGRNWNFEATATGIESAALLRLLRLMINVPTDLSVQGNLDASLEIAGRTDRTLPSLTRMQVRGTDLGFTNAEGSFAAEGVDVDSQLQVTAENPDELAFAGFFDSARGDALFGNVYLRLGEHPTRIDIDGTLADRRLQIRRLEAKQRNLAHLTLAAQLAQPRPFREAPLDFANLRTESAQLELHGLDLPAAYRSYLQTALGGTALDSLEAAGRMRGSLAILDNQPAAADLSLDGVSLRDTKGLFFIEGLNGRISWVPESEEPVEPSTLRWDAAGLYEVRGAGASLRLVLRGLSAALLEPVRLPVFDGAINVQTLRVRDAGQPSMQLQFAGEIEPISLAEISTAFAWPALGGFITGRIPSVEFQGNTLSFGGDLEAEIFDGLVRGSNIRLTDPLGRWPRLTADLVLDNLDLETLTSTLEFGSITGRIDGGVDNLELFAWAPVAFDAWLRTPEDDRSRKRISVAAINSIANVGGTAGTGVAAALQTGALRFFSRYRYRQLAVRCILKDDVCELSGAPLSGDRYYLLEGAGVPRVNIIGNTGRVQWSQLLEQIAWQIETGGTFRVE